MRFVKLGFWFLASVLAGNIPAQVWNPITLGTQDTLRSVFFRNANLGFAVGDKFISNLGGGLSLDSGVIFRTLNGGATWSRTSIYNTGATAEFHFYSIFCSDDVTCHVGAYGINPPAAGRPMIYRTVTRGLNWTFQYEGGGYISSIYCSNDSVCYATSGDGIWKTVNRGVSWVNPSGVNVNDILRSINCLDTSICFAAGYCNTAGACNARGWSSGGLIVKTINGGTNWNQQASGTMQGLRSVHSPRFDTAWMVGDSGMILHTRNGGVSWSPQLTGTTRNLRSVYFVNIDSGWVVGDSGTILHTIDGGSTWNPQASGTAQNLYSVHFPTPTVGYAVGAGGILLKYGPPVGISPAKFRKGELIRNHNAPFIDANGKRKQKKVCRTCITYPRVKK